MASSSRIPIPLKQHWYRFRVGAMPVIAFAACVLLMMVLWQRQAYRGSFVGEVEAMSVDVTSDIAGELTFPNDTFWQIYDVVKQGQSIARLDDRVTLARMDTVRAEIAKLNEELKEAETSLKNDNLALDQRHSQEHRQLLLEVESRQLQQLQLKADLAVDQASRRSLKDDIRFLKGINSSSVLDLNRQLDVVETRMRQNLNILEELNTQLETANQRLQGYGELQLPDVETVLTPIRASILVQQSIIKEIDLELESLTIQAPIDGVISAIHHLPGERIVAGEPIVTIARRGSTTVVSYIREKTGVAPYEGMRVGLRYRSPGSPEFQGTVDFVGPHVEPVPSHQLKDLATPEWATPVRITIPDDMLREGVRPGQLLHVILKDRPGSRDSGS